MDMASYSTMHNKSLRALPAAELCVGLKKEDAANGRPLKRRRAGR